MNIKKITALLLALLLFAFALVSCADKPDDEKGGEEESSKVAPSVTDELKKYKIIRNGDKTEHASMCMKLANAIGDVTGQKPDIRNDESVPADDSLYEILIGDTNRSQSATAKNALGTDIKYSITKDGNKIVINAANDIILEDAVEYFIDNLKKNTDGTCEYVIDYVSDTYEEIELVSGKKANYTVVFTDFYNNLNKHTDSHKDEFGFTRQMTKDFVGELKMLTGVTFEYYPEANMSYGKNEIIIGKFKGDSNEYFDYYQNGVYLKDGDIYIYGHNQEDIEKAVNNVLARVRRYNKVAGDETYSLLCNTEGFKWNDDNVKYDIPLPNNIKFEGVYSTANNGRYMVYDNCSQDVFDAYCDQLEAAGFEKYFDRLVATNLFAGYHLGDDAAWVYYITDRKELRIAFETYQPLPNLDSGEPKVQDAYVVQMGVSYTSGKPYQGAGMGYIIGLEDGRYVVVDGNTASDINALTDKYYNYMKDNNKRADGKVVIAAWILTHGHVDHYKNFENFGRRYGSQVECQYIIHNIPPALTLWGAGNVDTYLLNAENVKMLSSSFKGSTTFTAHTGYATNIGGVFFEVMATYEDLYNNHDVVQHSVDTTVSHSFDEMNDSNIIFRFTFNQGTNDEAKVFFLGDSYFAQGERLSSMWPEQYMRSAVVQVAHHGWNNGAASGQVDSKNGVSREIISNCYKEIRAVYGFYSNYYNHMINQPVFNNILKKYSPTLSANTVFCNDYDGVATNTKMTFNGGIKAEKFT